MKVTIFDYGAGNIHSLAKALTAAGVSVLVETDPAQALETDVLVLPGVGAFGAAAERLAPARDRMVAALRDGLPCLGICLGMQLLFDRSDEAVSDSRGLGLIPGHVRRLTSRRVPQIGWNPIEPGEDPLIGAAPLDYAYYANSYVCRPLDPASVVRAWSTHDEDRFPAVVRSGRTIGVQFHPEKSSQPGLRFLRAFLDEARS